MIRQSARRIRLIGMDASLEGDTFGLHVDNGFVCCRLLRL